MRAPPLPGPSWWEGAGGQPSGTRCHRHPHHAKESEVMTKEEHAALLRSLAVDRLLQLVTLEAKRLHDGHVTIVALTTHYQVARSEEHTSELQSRGHLVCRLL